MGAELSDVSADRAGRVVISVIAVPDCRNARVDVGLSAHAFVRDVSGTLAGRGSYRIGVGVPRDECLSFASLTPTAFAQALAVCRAGGGFYLYPLAERVPERVAKITLVHMLTAFAHKGGVALLGAGRLGRSTRVIMPECVDRVGLLKVSAFAKVCHVSLLRAGGLDRFYLVGVADAASSWIVAVWLSKSKSISFHSSLLISLASSDKTS